MEAYDHRLFLQESQPPGRYTYISPVWIQGCVCSVEVGYSCGALLRLFLYCFLVSLKSDDINCNLGSSFNIAGIPLA